MERPNDDLLDRWLKAEDDGLDAEAEAALTALFAALPMAAAPAPGFAGRVLATLQAPAPARRTARFPLWARAAAVPRAFLASPWGRASLGLGLVAAAFGLPLLLAALAPLLDLLRPALLAPAFAHVLTEASGWVLSGLRVWYWFAAFVRTLLKPLESPAVAAAMGACLLVPALALRLLFDLIQRERNWTHANPI